MKSYPITIEALDTLAKCVAELDGASPQFRPLVEAGHDAIRTTLGDDVRLLYSVDEEEAG